MKKITFFFLSCFVSNYGNTQDWSTGLNGSGAGLLGTTFNSPIQIYTNNANIARFSIPNFAYGGLNGSGQGLSIFDPAAGSPASGRLDIFTSAMNQTEIRFGSNGNIVGRNNRFEIHGNFSGLYFNSTSGSTKFARAGVVNGFIANSTSAYWRLGLQGDASNLAGMRRLEVVDPLAQLRLTNGGTNAPSTVYTDFFTNPSGHMVYDATGNRFGIETGILPVGNTLHINSILANATTANGFSQAPGFAAPTGTSGLRFEDLRSNSIPQLNPGLGVLSVDANGDVIYVPAGGGNPFADCVNGPVPNLTAPSSGLNLNSNRLYFLNGPTNLPTENQISLGNACNAFILGKFDVNNSAQDHGIHASSSYPAGTIGTRTGIFGRCTNTEIAVGVMGQGNFGTDESVGVQGRGMNSQLGIGVRGTGQSSTIAVGVWGNGTNLAVIPGGYAYGGVFTATSPTETGANVGVYGQAVGGLKSNYGGYFTANDGTTCIGVYGMASSTAVGAVNYGGWFVGQTMLTGNSIALSDSSIKENVFKESDALINLTRLNPVTYSMNQNQNPELQLSSGLQHGFIAQEVEQVYPELVSTVVNPATFDTLGIQLTQEKTLKGLNYNGFISINTQAILELNQKVENLSLSDQNIKTNMVDLNNSLDKILDMRGVSFDWTSNAQSEFNLENSNQVGFIAQEMQLVDARLTFIGSDSMLHVKYEKVVPILVESIQELHETVEDQQETINDLNDRLTTLENCLSGILPFLCSSSNSAIQPTSEAVQEQLKSIIDVQLSNKNSIVLNQNVPNPFAESTVISYSVPSSVQRAQIHFYDATGKLINSVDISERGEGQLNVYANDLSSGIYTYSLVADGKVVSTKKMMKQ